MKKKITCIECPKGCSLRVDIENCRVVETKGAKCARGKKYAVSETESPERILTSAVVAEGLALKLIPVKTSTAIPKKSILEAMGEVKKVRLNHTVQEGEIIIKNILGLEADLIATRASE